MTTEKHRCPHHCLVPDTVVTEMVASVQKRRCNSKPPGGKSGEQTIEISTTIGGCGPDGAVD